MTIPVAAAVGIANILTDLAIVLVAAKIGDEIFRRLGQPVIIGEILAGVIIGPSVIGIVEPGEVLEVFAELGVVFLLFWVGLETRISELRAVGRAAVLAGTLGMLLPFAGGLGLGLAIEDEFGSALFLAAGLVATSVGITSAVLLDLGLLASRPARTILGAAIVDDILALLLLAIAAGAVAEGGVSVTEIVFVFTVAVGFVVFVALGGTAFMRRRPQILTAPRFAESPLLPAVILCLGLAAFSAQVGLAAIIGAFLAGLMVAETKEQQPIESEIAPLYAFFPPFFFVFIGLSIDLSTLGEIETVGLLAAVTALAVATKLAGAALGAQSLGRRGAAIVGVGMVPRGEVGIIVAGIGRAEGVISDELFAIIVGMSVLTTLAAPLALRALARQGLPESEPVHQ